MVRYGVPWPAEQLVVHPGWVGSYDTARKNPRFTMQYVSRAHAMALDRLDPTEKPTRKGEKFYPDPALPRHLRAMPDDYRDSGYDRGHLVSVADVKHLSQEAVDHTFNMSNVAPQVGKGFNRSYWARLEHFVRQLVVLRCHDAVVITGPLYLPRKGDDGKLYVTYEVIGGNQVAVPTHFFKVCA